MVKHFILAGVMTLSGIFVNAQPVAHSIFLGGDIVIASESQEVVEREQKIQLTQIRIMPEIGYFLTDHMALGISAGVSSSISKRNRQGNLDSKSSESMILVAPFIRYYLSSGKLGIFTEGNLYIGSGFIKRTDDDHTEKGNSTQLSIGVSPGVYYEIHPKMTLEFSAGWLGYRYRARKIEGVKETSDNLGFDIGTTGLSLGLTFKL